MLTWMRRWAPVIMIVALVGFMLTIFIEWGMGLENMPGRSGSTVGKIGGKSVDIREFSRILELERQSRRQQGQNVSDDGNLPMQVWNSYVSETITNNTIRNMGLGATDEEVYAYLVDNPHPAFTQSEYFQTNGQFDKNKYIAFINTPSTYDNPTVQQIEQYIRNVMVPLGKLNSLIELGNIPSYSEIEYEYKSQKERVSFEYIMMNTDSIYLSEESLSDENLRKYYDKNVGDFKTDEKATIYFARFPKTTTERDELLIITELREIKTNVLSGITSFEEEARVGSDDQGSARNSGELGWFGRGMMVPEFENVAFSMNVGDISEPFKSNYGYHIIQLDSVKKEDDTVVEVKARHILKYITAGVETLDSIEALAVKLRNSAEDKNLIDAGIEHLVAIDSTLPFGRGENPSGIGFVANLGFFVFDKDAKSGDVSEVFETENAFFVLQLKEKIAKGNLPFEHARQRIRQIVRDSLQSAGAKTYLADISQKINEMSFDEFVESDGKLIAGKADATTRKQFIPNVGYNNNVIALAFALPENKISNPISSDNGVFILRTTQKELVREMPQDAPEIASIRSQIRSDITRRSYENWFNASKNQLKVSENVRDFYY